MSKLDDILLGIAEECGTINKDVANEARDIKALMLELIGEDEPMLNHGDPDYNHENAVDSETRNEFRAELRQKVEEL